VAGHEPRLVVSRDQVGGHAIPLKQHLAEPLEPLNRRHRLGARTQHVWNQQIEVLPRELRGNVRPLLPAELDAGPDPGRVSLLLALGTPCATTASATRTRRRALSRPRRRAATASLGPHAATTIIAPYATAAIVGPHRASTIVAPRARAAIVGARPAAPILTPDAGTARSASRTRAG
jgi:hypothetical protein